MLWLVQALVPVHPTDIFVSQNRFRFICGTQPIKHTHRKQKLQNRNNLSSAPTGFGYLYLFTVPYPDTFLILFICLPPNMPANQSPPVKKENVSSLLCKLCTKLHDISSLHHVLQDRPFRWKERALLLLLLLLRFGFLCLS